MRRGVNESKQQVVAHSGIIPFSVIVHFFSIRWPLPLVNQFDGSNPSVKAARLPVTCTHTQSISMVLVRKRAAVGHLSKVVCWSSLMLPEPQHVFSYIAVTCTQKPPSLSDITSQQMISDWKFVITKIKLKVHIWSPTWPLRECTRQAVAIKWKFVSCACVCDYCLVPSQSTVAP